MGHAAIKITDKWQFTIPNRFRSQLQIKPGDYLEPEVKDGILVLKPRKQILIDPDQAWFWTKAHQIAEREAEGERRAGRIHHAKSARELIRKLDA